MPRVTTPVRLTAVAAAALAAILIIALLVPRGAEPDGALVPRGDQQYAARQSPAGLGRINTDMETAIDRAMRADKGSGTRCATFEEQQYCLGTGWTNDSPTQVNLEFRRTAAARSLARESTGDLDASAWLSRRASEPTAERLAADRAEFEAAARSVSKVVLLRHEILGEPLPTGFLARHPEARTSSTDSAGFAQDSSFDRGSSTSSPSPTPTGKTTSTPTTAPSVSSSPTPVSNDSDAVDPQRKRNRDYPQSAAILDPAHTREQTRYYWCGPTTMQMIVWGWGRKRSQGHWARELGTTTSGTAITDMVRVVNQKTGWDNKHHAGPYITLDISDWGFRQWMLLQMRHIVDYRAPVVLHPVLLKKYYPYVDDDASGHFQVGRGYKKRGKKPNLLGYFEPWNQQRFDPSEPYIDRVQWRLAYRSYRANEAHFQHNIGV